MATVKMRDGTYDITDRMVGVSDEEGETTEGLCHWRKVGGIREKGFPMSVMIGTLLVGKHVKPRRENLF